MKRPSVFLSLVSLALPLAAQVDRANINGAVTDASNAVVPMATVRAVSADTGLQREAHTSPGGTYEIPSLPVGTYDVTFLKDGFKPLMVKSIVLTNGQSRTVDGRLEVGATSEAVQVTASAEVVNAHRPRGRGRGGIGGRSTRSR